MSAGPRSEAGELAFSIVEMTEISVLPSTPGANRTRIEIKPLVTGAAIERARVALHNAFERGVDAARAAGKSRPESPFK